MTSHPLKRLRFIKLNVEHWTAWRRNVHSAPRMVLAETGRRENGENFYDAHSRIKFALNKLRLARDAAKAGNHANCNAVLKGLVLEAAPGGCRGGDEKVFPSVIVEFGHFQTFSFRIFAKTARNQCRMGNAEPLDDQAGTVAHVISAAPTGYRNSRF